MQFLTSLFGGGGNTILSTVLALGIVLILIVAAVWVLKFVFRASSNIGRGRTPRLMLVDSMTVDPKRQLLIVRRDNVEHLILTGGPQDVVVETGIAAEKPAQRRPIPAIPSKDNPFIEPETPSPAKSAVERLRDFARPAGQRSSRSLRHTGLMRPVSRMEVIQGFADNVDHSLTDSAKTPAAEAKGQAKGGEAVYPRDGFKAGGS